jgi:hypothetical protein
MLHFILLVGIGEVHLQGINPAAEVASQIFEIVKVGDFRRENGPAYTHGDGLATLIEELVGQRERSEHWVYPAQKVKPTTIFAFEVDWNYRHIGILYELDNIVGPERCLQR